MPIQLRSGALSQAPKKKYANSYQIYYEERAKAFPNLTHAQKATAISEEFEKLSESRRRPYEEAYQKHHQEYKDQLLLWYGGNKNDVKRYHQGIDIPDKPRKPIAPALRYQHEILPTLQKEHPEEERVTLQKMASEMFKKLTTKEANVYHKQYDSEYETYKKEKEAWKSKYSDKLDAQEKFVDEKFRRSAQRNDAEFVYQEYVKPKRVKKMSEAPKEKMGSKKKMGRKPKAQ